MLGLANPNHLQNPRPPTREIIKLISIKNTAGFDLEWITLRTSPRTLQNVTNLAKFCPPLKTHSQTRSNTSPILLNSVPLSKHTLRHSAIRHQSCQILSPNNMHTICAQHAHNIIPIWCNIFSLRLLAGVSRAGAGT